jgi:PAS domain S-box-containing protein
MRVNKVAADFYGMSMAEVTGKSLYELNPKNAEKHHIQDLKVIASGRPSLGEVKLVFVADNVARWNSVDKIPYKDPLTGDDRILVVATDLTKQMSIENALRRSEERYNLAIEQAAVGTWEHDLKTGDLYWSPRLKKMLGLAEEKFVPRISEFEDRLHPDDREGVMSRRKAHLYDKRPLVGEFRLRHEDGHYVWVGARGQAIWDDDGNPLRMAGSMEDITVRKDAEAELVRHRDHLQELVGEATQELKVKAEELELALGKERELNQLQRQFVSMASHEFRTPLAIIDGAAQGLRRRADRLTSDEAIKRVDKIRVAVKRLVRLMESTLMAVRVEEGRVSIEIEACDLGEVVRQVCERQQDVAPNHTIRCDLVDLPDAIQADSGALEQVLTNLLSNAVKYSPDAPEIEVVARGGGSEVMISVTDHGIGIDEDDMPRMFERFFRAKSATGIAGTGIGLNLSLHLVKLHGGSMAVESRVGEGSTFTVRLPVDGSQAATQSQSQAA